MSAREFETNNKVDRKSDKCPFCGKHPHSVVFPSSRGWSAYLQCQNDKCGVNPYTRPYESATEKGAISKARKIWDKRSRR